MKIRDRDLRPLLDGISLPVLVACGGEDQVCAPEASRVMSGRMGNAFLHLFPGKGHAPFLTDTESFNGKLRSFIEDE